jgi:DNA-binding MarR family transcriptional regulator/N-acetylglutamate synthase-like GNAT family acetyltransferase
VLWEVGTGGCDVRVLRARLDLDSGYLSRLLRSLEGNGLVTVETSAQDGRVRTARLTRRGRAERAVLDRRSDALAAALLEPLTPSQQERLVTAMRDVERLLTAGLIEIAAVDPAEPRAQHCLGEYYAELDRRFDAGFDPDVTRPALLDDMRAPNGAFLVAMLRDEPIACGALKVHGDDPAEIKRMWVSPDARGLGVARRLLAELEARAAARGSASVRLDTNAALVEAINLYRSTGYREINAFNDEPYADHWFEKALS